jgi:hypothetical protein
MADNQPIRPLQPVGSTLVATRPRATGTGQDILVEATPLGGRLAWLLASLDGGDEPGRERVQGRQFYVIRHSADLDDHVTELIDTLIGMRIAHPRLVQLELDLADGEVTP